MSVFVKVRHVGKALKCSVEKFFEVHAKVEAVVRNCLLM